jgi:HSP20 family protein
MSDTSSTTTSIGNEGLIAGAAGPLGEQAHPQGSETPASEPPGAPGTLLAPSGATHSVLDALPGTDSAAGRDRAPESAGSASAAAVTERAPAPRNAGRAPRGPGDVDMGADPLPGAGTACWNASPWAWVRSWSEQMDRMFDELMRLDAWRGTPAMSHFRGSPHVPAVRTRRRDGSVEVVADLPGVERDALQVSLDANVLTIAGERREEEERSHAAGTPWTLHHGRFERTVVLPAEVDPEGAEATLRNGVLRVTLPVATRTRGHRIDVRDE